MDIMSQVLAIFFTALWFVLNLFESMPKTLNSKQQLLDILAKDYELRNIHEHQILTNIIRQTVPSCSAQLAKQLSFYAQLRSTEIQGQVFQIGTILLFLVNQQSLEFQYRQIANASQNQDLLDDRMCIFIEGKKILNCQNIGTIEDQVKFLQSCPHFKDVSKRKLCHLLRNSKIRKYSFGDYVYQQNDTIAANAEGVFIIREGQFCFSKRDQFGIKSFQLVTCSKGHLFGNEVKGGQDMKIKRKHTVTCKSSTGLIYRIEDDFFNSILRKQCENIIIENNLKINELAELNFLKISKNNLQNSQFLYQTSRRSQSSLQRFSNQKMTQPLNFKSTTKITQPQQSKTKIDFPSLQRKTHRQFKKSFNPEYQEQMQILRKKQNCSKLKELAKLSSSKLTRGEVLFGLMKTSWQFQRDRRKPILKH